MPLLYESSMDGAIRAHAVSDGTLGIGRDARNAVVLGDPTVSRFHCRLQITGQLAVLEDLKSSNGTFLHGRRVLGAIVVPSGAVIRAGNRELVYIDERPESRRSLDPTEHNTQSPEVPGPGHGRQPWSVRKGLRLRVRWALSPCGVLLEWQLRRR